MIGIIGALEVEIRNILGQMEGKVTHNIGGLDFIEGKLSGNPVVVARCGVGKVNAAHCTSNMLTSFNVTGVINTGVAGGISPDVNIGDVVISTDLVQHDVEASEFGYAIGQVPGMDTIYFPACKNLIEMVEKSAKYAMSGDKTLHIGRIATGDQFISKPEAKNAIWNNHQALCTEMEGGAIAQVCYLTDTPFVVIRAISDKADGTAHKDFHAFAEDAAATSAKIVMDLVMVYG